MYPQIYLITFLYKTLLGREIAKCSKSHALTNREHILCYFFKLHFALSFDLKEKFSH